MPRKNENAHHGAHEKRLRSWNYGFRNSDHLREIPPLNERIIRNFISREYGYRDPSRMNPLISQSTFKITGESIVREHRRQQTIGDLKKVAILRQTHVQGPSKSLFQKIFNRINWNAILEYACWGAAIGCLIYIGIFIVMPFIIKLAW